MRAIALLRRYIPSISFSNTYEILASPLFPAIQTPIRKSHFPLVQNPRPIELDNPIDSIHFIASDPCFYLLGLCNSISSLKKIHAQLILNGLTQNLLCQTKLVSLYGFFGNVERARQVFDEIPNPDLYSWKVMIRWYFLHYYFSEMLDFYSSMKRCIRNPGNVVFSIMFKACTELRDLDEGMKLHCHVIKVGDPDSFVLTGLIDMYAKCGTIAFARWVFDEMPERDVVSWTSMIVGYVQNECSEEGLVLFNQMRLSLANPNQFTLGSLLAACSKLDALHQGQWLHGLVIKNGLELNSFLATALLDMYVKCGSVLDARVVFDELSTVELVSWTAMIVGYTQRCYPFEALKVFTDKKSAGLVPNSVTLASVLSSCAQSCNLNLGISVHVLGIKLGLDGDAAVRNALLDMHAKCGMIEDANYIFESILYKDIIAWNAMIAGYSQNGFGYDALLLFNRMRLDSLAPDAVTVVSVLSACAYVGALCVGNSLHAYAVKKGFMSSVFVGTNLLNLYAKCGDMESARTVFDGMGVKNIVTWSAMMGGYGMHGDALESLSMFTNMLKENLQPNDVMFTSILSAFSHTGMVEEGLKYFNVMDREYCVSPSMKHYACMVDLLARAGRLEDALEFIEKMPIQADASSVWGAFLHGCRLHSRMDLGEVATRRMQELHPADAGYYVLMSHLYASDGKWDEAAKVRELMKERGLNKSPGYSSVEMDNSLHSKLMSMQ